MFPDYWHHSVNPFPHVPDVLNGGAVGCRLLLPGLSRYIQESPRLVAEQELEGRETSRGLGYLPDAKEHTRQHPVPIAFVFGGHAAEHLLEGLVEPFDQSIRLGMVDGSPELFDLQEATEVSH